MTGGKVGAFAKNREAADMRTELSRRIWDFLWVWTALGPNGTCKFCLGPAQ